MYTESYMYTYRETIERSQTYVAQKVVSRLRQAAVDDARMEDHQALQECLQAKPDIDIILSEIDIDL